MVGQQVLHAEPVVQDRPDVALSMVGVRAARRADFDASRLPGRLRWLRRGSGSNGRVHAVGLTFGGTVRA